MADAVLSVQDELAAAAARLRSAGIPAPRREALLLWSGLEGASPGDVALRDRASDGGMVGRFRNAVCRRVAGEPIQYVVGTTGFRRLVLATDRRALIPRPETEGVVDLALRMAPVGRALDLGTGTGCLALALAEEGGYRDVTGVDISPAALALARENGTRAGLAVRWLEGEWIEPVRSELFDVIVTNPPYIASVELERLDRSVTDWEPHLALDGGPDGLGPPRRILSEAHLVLSSGGTLIMELDATRAQSTAELARCAGWRDVHVYDDLFGRPRYLAARREPHDAG